MFRKWALAILVIFIVWVGYEFLFHGVVLDSFYEATSQVWRPPADMTSLMWFGFVSALVEVTIFVSTYALLMVRKSVVMGLVYGALLGLLAGIVQFRFYGHLPIPLSLATSWLLITWGQLTLSGILVGLIVRPTKKK